MKSLQQRIFVLAAPAIALGGLGGCNGGPPGGAGGSGGGGKPLGPVPVALSIEANRVIADPGRGVFYATVRKDAKKDADSVVVVDAGTGEILSSTVVGSNPWTMALSDDGSTLWVSLRGSNEIRRIDLGSGAPVPAGIYMVPTSPGDGPTYADDMVVLRGTKDSVALLRSREFASGNQVPIVMDAGVARPKTLGANTVYQLTGGPGGWLFGCQDSNEPDFYSILVEQDGLTLGAQVSHVIQSLTGFDLVYADGRVYATSGQVLDVSTPESPIKVGTFADTGVAILPLPSAMRALLLSVNSHDDLATLRLLDTSTFGQLDAVTFDKLLLQAATDLASPDGKSLAFIGEDGYGSGPHLVVLTTPFAE